jgi:purine-binding chemotaxis protein CheW
VVEVAASSLQETPKVGMRWRPEFIRCIGKRGDDFMVVLDIARVFAGASHDVAAHDGAVTAEQPSAGPVPVS